MSCSVRRGACTALALASATLVLAAQQQPVSFRIERPIVASGAGPHRLAINVSLLARARPFTSVRSFGQWNWRAEQGLADLRIYDAQDHEVPYLLVHPVRAPEWAAGVILPIAATKKTSGFEADLGHVRTVDLFVLEGLPAPFLKRLVLEGSGDRERWTLLAGEGTVFDLPQERLRQLSVPFTAGTYRYIRVTWDDTNSGRLPLPERVSARVAIRDGAARQIVTAALPVQRRPSEPGQSRYRLRLPAAGLPIVAITLDVGPGHVYRPASISEARFEGSQVAPVTLGREMLARVERNGAIASALRIRITPPRESELELTIDDGSNPPLEIRSVSLELAELPWIYFEAPGGPLRARYGNASVAAPVYDLEAVRATINLAALPEARWGEPHELTPTTAPTPAPPMPATGAAIDPGTFRFRRAIPPGAGGLMALPLDVAALAHSRGPASSFADVRIADQGGRQVPYLLERRGEPLSMPLPVRAAAPGSGRLKDPALQSQPGHSRSIYSISLPYPRLPSPRIVLETSDRVFQRHVQVIIERPADRGHRDPWLDAIDSMVWQHAAPDVSAPAAVLRLREEENASELLVVVDEGDNRPLTISRAELLLPSWRLRFFSPSAGLSLLYGSPQLPSPRYDLALLAPQVMGAEAREVEAAPETSGGPESEPTFVTPRSFWIGLSVGVLVLLAVIAKLVASASATASPPAPPAP